MQPAARRNGTWGSHRHEQTKKNNEEREKERKKERQKEHKNMQPSSATVRLAQADELQNVTTS
jgi:hypothetical protein